jgi:RimJ/RimL family protein N-acetyltransferase
MYPFLKGERVYLRAVKDDDANDSVRWFNDAEVCAGNSHYVFPYTRQDAIEYIYNTEDLVLAIITEVEPIINNEKFHKHIGNVALQNIHPVYRSADFSIIIGEKDYWGKGYGKEAARLLINHGFSAMNLHRISIATFEHNDPMRRLALSLGFKYEGWRHEAAFKHGRYVDVIEYGRIKGE